MNDNGTVISSRIRLARNISKVPFPCKASKNEQAGVFDAIVGVIPEIIELRNAQVLRLNDYDKIDRRLLMERHLVSYDLASKATGEPGLIFNSNEEVSVMVNEEDHYRLQSISQGLSIAHSWNMLSAIDDSLNEKLNFAFHERYGFLTSCPTNTGTGLRASCLLHLPALAMTESMEKLVSGLLKMNISVRGFYGEGSQPLGDIFQVSNAVSLGKSETELIENFEKIVETVIKYEQEAKNKISMGTLKARMEDRISRAYGILTHARAIDSEEAIGHLTKLKLTDDMGMNLSFNRDQLDQLVFIIQPGHLQEMENSILEETRRDIYRAEFIRKRLFN